MKKHQILNLGDLRSFNWYLVLHILVQSERLECTWSTPILKKDGDTIENFGFSLRNWLLKVPYEGIVVLIFLESSISLHLLNATNHSKLVLLI